MKFYSIFDDFDEQAIATVRDAGGELTVHPLGVPRPDSVRMKSILEEYDGVFIGTSQKISEDMFESISSPRIIATASVGTDHINIPKDKQSLVSIINTPKANAQSVAEYTFACALSAVKRLGEGAALYRAGKNNKSLRRKPEDLSGKVIGVVGAGNISVKIMEYARFFGMDILCFTRNPEKHKELEKSGVEFVSLSKLCSSADIISVNLPNNPGTQGIISKKLVSEMKQTAVFISVSRLQSVDTDALLKKAADCPDFYLYLDIDLEEELIARLPEKDNIVITPHIAGGTVETRKRMFRELAQAVIQLF